MGELVEIIVFHPSSTNFSHLILTIPVYKAPHVPVNKGCKIICRSSKVVIKLIELKLKLIFAIKIVYLLSFYVMVLLIYINEYTQKIPHPV